MDVFAEVRALVEVIARGRVGALLEAESVRLLDGRVDMVKARTARIR